MRCGDDEMWIEVDEDKEVGTKWGHKWVTNKVTNRGHK
jgi:hypothetical protein